MNLFEQAYSFTPGQEAKIVLPLGDLPSGSYILSLRSDRGNALKLIALAR